MPQPWQRSGWLIMSVLVVVAWLTRLALVPVLVLAAQQARDDLPAPALAAVQQVVVAMEKAVQAADVDGYLQHVAQADPFFRQEQQCWAQDLKKVKPESFVIRWEKAQVAADGQRVTGEMTWQWRIPNAKNDRKLTFPSQFVREGEQWKFAGEVWLRVDCAGCQVLFLDEKLRAEAQSIAEIFPEIRRQVFADLAEQEPEQMQVKLYPRMLHLQASIFLSYVDGIAGWNEPGESIKLLSMRQGGASKTLRATLAHELGHAATWQMGPKAKSIPWWVQEGVAEQVAEFYSNKRRTSANTVAALLKSKQLCTWEKIHDFSPDTLRLSLQVYNQGHHMCAWLTDRFGKPKRNEWLRALANGETLEQASQKVFGTPFSTLAEEWQKAIEGNPFIIVKPNGEPPPGQKPEAPPPAGNTPENAPADAQVETPFQSPRQTGPAKTCAPWPCPEDECSEGDILFLLLNVFSVPCSTQSRPKGLSSAACKIRTKCRAELRTLPGR